jgi:hypothetical protein
MTAVRAGRRSSSACRLLQAVLLVVAMLCSAAVLAAGEKPAAGLSREEMLRLGETIYRDGILPSGEPVMATVQGDIAVEGTMFSCASCHLRGGLGSNEGRVSTLPTNGRSLYFPQDNNPKPFTTIEKNFNKFREIHRRPVYTDETLADAIRLGIDPAGREFDQTMPRYDLNSRDMGILIAYLKVLSSETPPGVTEKSIRFATVIAGDVSPEDRDAMVLPLEAFVRERNSRANVVSRRIRMRATVEGLNLASRGMSLARWELAGPPQTWRAQLEEHYRKDPVFALLGGISSGDWAPISEFCEEHRIPCIFPVTDYPVISETNWYTLYFSKGLYQEGDGAARYLRRAIDDPSGVSFVQVYRDGPEGRALATGFREACNELGLPAPVDRVIPEKTPITDDLLREVTAGDPKAVLLLWLGPEVYPALETLASSPAPPAKVFVAFGLLKQEYGRLPEKARDFTFMTYPYRLPQEEAQYATPAKAWLFAKRIPVNDRRISTRMYSMLGIVSLAFGNMRENVYRGNFIDSISVLPDLLYPDYERLSFGPGQQFASKGCFIVQVDHGEKPLLRKRSEWVIH